MAVELLEFAAFSNPVIRFPELVTETAAAFPPTPPEPPIERPPAKVALALPLTLKPPFPPPPPIL